MPQSIPVSFLEAASNTVGGFVLAWLSWVYIVGPLFGYEVHLGSGFVLTSFFAGLSLIRGFVVRRIFNKMEARP